MSRFNSSGLIGLDVKPRRKVPWPSRNRYVETSFRWLFPVIIALLTLGIFAVIGTR